MSYEEMQVVLGQILGVQIQIQENQLKHELDMVELRESLTKTEAIANSNARAIEASANEGAETKKDLRRLVGIVANFVEATNRRLDIVESK